ncbi:TonB-dependent receptor [Sphingopyxis panaciterrulae]|uniref:TonB-dependent receptor n=1 Tax=Sphingopyxis panaciterrulae TaxID=462372 RepID=A0A7W9B9B1_9SPHN|nr:TonB-dependent receptor [Sphingopyxis panaciterrulae]MBB5708623.1 TonB-dependent receptor [Sphingopyxis panaciterrulae]
MRHAWKYGISLFALAAAVQPALAQSEPDGDTTKVASVDPEDSGPQGDDIIVSGYKLQAQRAVEAKRDNLQISDSVTTDDIASLPDFNLAEALQRLPGVNTDQDNGEERFLTIRGMNKEYNFTTVDGLVVPSTDEGSRGVLLDTIPSSVAKRVDVNKSFTADMDGQAIGGRIDLKTRSAFDRSGMLLAANASIGFYENNDEGPIKVDPSIQAYGVFSQSFGTEHNFGIVLGASYWKRESYTESPTNAGSTGYYWFSQDGVGGETPDANPVPRDPYMYLYYNKRERTGLFAKLEYQSDDRNFYAYVQGYQFNRDDRERRDIARISNKDYKNIPADITPTSGHVLGRVEPLVESAYDIFRDRTRGVNAGFDYRFAERHLLEARIGYSKADLNLDVQKARFYRTQNKDLSYTYNRLNDGSYYYTFDNSGIFSDPSSYNNFHYISLEPRSNDERVKEAHLDYSYNLDKDSRGFGVKAGFVARSTERERSQSYSEYRAKSGVAVSLKDYVLEDTFQTPMFSDPMIFIDLDRILNYFDSNQDNFNLQAASAKLTQYDINEDILAGYAMGVFRTDNLRVTAGVRYEHTKIGTSSPNADPELGLDYFNNKYGTWLPRADLSYDITNSLRLRLAYSKSVGRANYDSLSPVTIVTDSGPEVVITGGNPDLKPRISNNYDMTLEYYFPTIKGLVALGLFHKDIDNEIYRNQVRGTIEYGGVQRDAVFVNPQNAQSASLTGMEAGIILDSLAPLSSALEGFGLSANYAYIHSKAEIGYTSGGQNLTREIYGLFYQPKHMGNVALTYETGPFDAKIAYTYQGMQMKSIAVEDKPGFDHLYAARSSVDLQLRYWLTKKVQLVLQGKNLADNKPHEIVGEEQRLHHTFRDAGRSYWAGFSFKF